MRMPPLPANMLEMSDYELGGLLLGWFIAVQADDLGIPFERIDQIPESFAERVRQFVLTIETDTAKNAAVEKALHKAASGDFESAGKFLREHMTNGAMHLVALDEAVTGKRRQRANAKKSRSDELQILIETIMATLPSIKPVGLLDELRKQEGGGIIEEITDDDIFFINKDGHGGESAKVSGLKDRMSRARKKIASL